MKNRNLLEENKELKEELRKTQLALQLYQGALHENHNMIHLLSELKEWLKGEIKSKGIINCDTVLSARQREGKKQCLDKITELEEKYFDYNKNK